jgi:hypothetical protein
MRHESSLADLAIAPDRAVRRTVARTADCPEQCLEGLLLEFPAEVLSNPAFKRLLASNPALMNRWCPEAICIVATSAEAAVAAQAVAENHEAEAFMRWFSVRGRPLFVAVTGETHDSVATVCKLGLKTERHFRALGHLYAVSGFSRVIWDAEFKFSSLTAYGRDGTVEFQANTDVSDDAPALLFPRYKADNTAAVVVEFISNGEILAHGETTVDWLLFEAVAKAGGQIGCQSRTDAGPGELPVEIKAWTTERADRWQVLVRQANAIAAELRLSQLVAFHSQELDEVILEDDEATALDVAEELSRFHDTGSGIDLEFEPIDPAVEPERQSQLIMELDRIATELVAVAVHDQGPSGTPRCEMVGNCGLVFERREVRFLFANGGLWVMEWEELMDTRVPKS